MQTARMLTKPPGPASLPLGTGTKIRFRQTDDSWWGDFSVTYKKFLKISEFAAYESATALGGNVLYGGDAYATSSDLGTTPGNAIDGSFATYWTADRNYPQYQSWWCDFGEEKTIRSVSITANVHLSWEKVAIPKAIAIDLWNGVEWVELVEVYPDNTYNDGISYITKTFENLQ